MSWPGSSHVRIFDCRDCGAEIDASLARAGRCVQCRELAFRKNREAWRDSR